MKPLPGEPPPSRDALAARKRQARKDQHWIYLTQRRPREFAKRQQRAKRRAWGRTLAQTRIQQRDHAALSHALATRQRIVADWLADERDLDARKARKDPS